MSRSVTRGPWLALDTSTGIAVLAIGDATGVSAGSGWLAGFRHGEELLVRLQALLDDQGMTARDLRAIVVGTGPGAFTGLRVGLATAKGLAFGLGLPIAGVSSAAALVEAARDAGFGDVAILLPAGPTDRILAERDASGQVRSRRLPGDVDPDPAPGRAIVALDLEGRAPEEAVARSAAVRAGLGAALLRLAADHLAAGGDDLERLVPDYVTPPRGVTHVAGDVTLERG